ncbi:MAG: hypothetical protein MI892_23740 [Desulfobacterales bacterium]|nr:hypothetical protein [Desulfobacterales bacterium]
MLILFILLVIANGIMLYINLKTPNIPSVTLKDGKNHLYTVKTPGKLDITARK